MIGRPRGGTNRYWSKEEKLRIVKKWLGGEGPQREIAKAEQISYAMVFYE